jgi:hypothetical protein
MHPFTAGSVCQISLSFIAFSIVTVVGLLGTMGLLTEGPELFSISGVCSDSSSAIASSSPSEDGLYLLQFLHQFQNSSQNAERLH